MPDSYARRTTQSSSLCSASGSCRQCASRTACRTCTSCVVCAPSSRSRSRRPRRRLKAAPAEAPSRPRCSRVRWRSRRLAGPRCALSPTSCIARARSPLPRRSCVNSCSHLHSSISIHSSWRGRRSNRILSTRYLLFVFTILVLINQITFMLTILRHDSNVFVLV